MAGDTGGQRWRHFEPLARSLRYDRIRLQVFGRNAVARNLYQSVGYVETDLLMEKRID